MTYIEKCKALKVTTMGDAIARGEELITSKGKGKELVAKLTKDLEKLKLGGSAADAKHAAKLEKFLAMVTKRGYIDNASRIALSKVASNFPASSGIQTGKAALEAAEKALKDIKKPTMTSRGLKLIKAQLPFLAPLIGSKVDDTLGLEAPAAESAGAIVMVAANKKSFLQFVAKKVPKVASKAMLAAAVDGPLPFGDMLALGFTVLEVANILNEWKKYSEK